MKLTDIANTTAKLYSKNINHKYYSKIQERLFICKKCGKKELLDYKTNEKLCSHCGNIIKKDKQPDFKDRMRQILNSKK